MYIANLREARKEKKISIVEMAESIKVHRLTYAKYDKELDVPSNYALKVCKKLEIELPKDFYKYTSSTLQINMFYYNITQKSMAEEFNLSQVGLSKIMHRERFMYEKKDIFDKLFNPLILPAIYNECERLILYEMVGEEKDLLSEVNIEKTNILISPFENNFQH